MPARLGAPPSITTPGFLQSRRSRLTVLALVAVGVIVSLYNYFAISDAFAKTESYYDARQQTQAMVESLFREESSLRGFTSTRDGEYLKPFVAAHIGFIRQLADLRSFLWTVGLGGTDPYLRDIGRVHDQWSDTVAEPLVDNPSGELAQSRQRTGELLFSTLNDDIGWLDDVLDSEAQASAKTARIRVLLAIGEIALVTVLFVLTALHMYRANRRIEHQYVNDLTDANKSLVNAQRLARVGNWTKDLRSGRLVWSDEMCRIFGVSRSQVNDALLRWFDHPEDAPAVNRVVKSASAEFAPYSVDHRILLSDGSVRYVQEQAEYSFDERGEPIQLAGSVLDVTQRKLAEEKLAHLAHHDALTGLPNRVLLLERLSQSMAFARRHETMTAVLYLDLDRFKIINDTLGHGVGDVVLKAVGERLSRAVRTSDTVARPGGDEFIIVLADVRDESDVRSVADKIVATFKDPFIVSDSEFFLSTSIGISLYPNDGDDVDSLIKHADAAMYQAKDKGRNNLQFYTAAIHEATLRKLSLENELRKGLERDEFVVHYQPIVAVATGAITGFEALVRWHHPTRGEILPDDFIPQAEESGLIVPLGDFVLRTACAELKEWERLGCTGGRVTVNISARQFQQRYLVDDIRRLVSDFRIAPKTLELELTESLVMSDIRESMRAFLELREMGVGVSMDDFGTGYSSLSYLKNFPISSLKIDRSFIDELTVDAFDDAISLAIVTLAKSLRIRVIAEGVETQAQLLKLRRLACDEAQGLYFSPPVPAAEARTLFQRLKVKEA
ncbi:MAG TPA: EAL domain-containing protein [Candidatus Eremiobacteraceae bacterium]|nr:EAL domain-containing protein [Candidatus Eremiobacteraceae bacterium]